MQGAHNLPFGLPSIAPRDSHEHISELYHFECLKCRSLSSLTWNFGLKTLLQQGISEPIFYSDLVYKGLKCRSLSRLTWNFGLKTLLQQGISEPIFYGDLVYKFKRIVGKPNYSDQFKKIVKRYIRVGYNLDIMRQSACLVLNPITVYSYGFLFNCTMVGQASDSMTALT